MWGNRASDFSIFFFIFYGAGPPDLLTDNGLPADFLSHDSQPDSTGEPTQPGKRGLLLYFGPRWGPLGRMGGGFLHFWMLFRCVGGDGVPVDPWAFPK